MRHLTRWGGVLARRALVAWLLALAAGLLCVWPSQTCLGQGGFNPPAVDSGTTGFEKGDLVLRDAFEGWVWPYTHAGHVGVFVGKNRYTGNEVRIVESPGYIKMLPPEPNHVRVSSYSDFVGSHAYWGARDYSLSWSQRNKVVAVALAQLGCPYASLANIKNPSTTPVYPDQPYYYMPGQGHATKSDGSFRCDGLAEYCYEQAGVNGGQGLFSPSEEADYLFARMSPRAMFDRTSPVLVLPPVATDAAPMAGAKIAGTVSIHSYVTDQEWGSGVEKADFSVDQSYVGTDSHQENVGGVYSVAWNTAGVSDGAHTINMTIYDQAGNWRTYRWQVQVSNQFKTFVSESDAAPSEGAPGFFRHGTPGYWHDAWGLGEGGHMLWTWNNGHAGIDNMGDWRPNLPATDRYEVFVFIPNNHAYTNQARYEIYHADGRSDVWVNQRQYNDVWVSLGTYRFNQGAGNLLRLIDYNDERYATTQIGFDAAKWERRN